MGENFTEDKTSDHSHVGNGATVEGADTGEVVYDSVGNRKGIVVRLKRWEAPSNAYLMGPNDVEQHVKRRFKQWDENKLNWMTHGKLINVASTGISSTILIAFFRSKFNIRAYKGFATLMMSGVMAPIGFTALASTLIEGKIEQVPTCQTCVETQAGAFQTSIVGFYPGFLAPLLCVYYSKQSLSFETAKTKFYPSMMYAYRLKPLQILIGLGIISANFASGFYVARMQNKEVNDYVIAEAVEKGQFFLEQFESDTEVKSSQS